MRKLLIGVGLQFGSSAVAIVLAALILPRFSVGVGGFFTAIVVFTIAQSILEWVIAKLAHVYTPILAWAASLASTWLALLIANVPSGGIRINGFTTWIFAALIIWALTGLCLVLVHKYLRLGAAK